MLPTRPSDRYLVDKIVRHARRIVRQYEGRLKCPNCNELPNQPVSGSCGHTRCTTCIERNGACPCGVPEPATLHINILVRDILQSISNARSQARYVTSTLVQLAQELNMSPQPSTSTGRRTNLLLTPSRRPIRAKAKSILKRETDKIVLSRLPVSTQMRYEYACGLALRGQTSVAAAHLAYVVAANEPLSHTAEKLLVKVMRILLRLYERRSLISYLHRLVFEVLAFSLVDPSDVECPICFNYMEHPVTTTCGHTFCRCCIKRVMLAKKVCPLCSSSLEDFHVSETEDTDFVCTLLRTVTKITEVELDVIPIFFITVAYPAIPCSLIIFEADYRNKIKLVLESGSRTCGVLASRGDDLNGTCGTLVEIRDCILFEDNKAILSTIGKSRFHVDETFVINGCLYARVRKHTDTIPVRNEAIVDLRILASRIRINVLHWLASLDSESINDIYSYFGQFPEMEAEGDWWNNPNGPVWLWWLIGVLPLRPEIQVLMLSSNDVLKRMQAVLRALNSLLFERLTNAKLDLDTAPRRRPSRIE